MVLRTGEIRFHHFDNNLFFQNLYNDTVFKIDENKITPSFILSRGMHRPPYESRWWPPGKKQKADFIYQPNYFENSRYISFNFYRNKIPHFALYDKLSKKFRIIENRSGIKNDIDNFIDLTFSSINKAGELSCLIQASELKQWIEKNPEKFKMLKPDLQKLRNIKMEDNPIVVIAKYKQ
jgi:hypothetical protein